VRAILETHPDGGAGVFGGYLWKALVAATKDDPRFKPVAERASRLLRAKNLLPWSIIAKERKIAFEGILARMSDAHARHLVQLDETGISGAGPLASPTTRTGIKINSDDAFPSLESISMIDFAEFIDIPSNFHRESGITVTMTPIAKEPMHVPMRRNVEHSNLAQDRMQTLLPEHKTATGKTSIADRENSVVGVHEISSTGKYPGSDATLADKAQVAVRNFSPSRTQLAHCSAESGSHHSTEIGQGVPCGHAPCAETSNRLQPASEAARSKDPCKFKSSASAIERSSLSTSPRGPTHFDELFQPSAHTSADHYVYEETIATYEEIRRSLRVQSLTDTSFSTNEKKK
jgi:hypothetical protein